MQPGYPDRLVQCGPERRAPTGRRAMAPTDTCVFASTASAFACDSALEHDDNTPATGTAIPPLTCVSPRVLAGGCIAANDGADWFQLAAPAGCTALEVKGGSRIRSRSSRWRSCSAIANGAQIVTDTACKNPPPGGEDSRCIKQTLTPGSELRARGQAARQGRHCDGTCTSIATRSPSSSTHPDTLEAVDGLRWSWLCVPYLVCARRSRRSASRRR